jgi:LacI family transcriptional regulator
MASTLKDVAARAGVHPSTVSRVLRGKENIPISKATKDRIFSAVRELNYHPDKTARALRLRRSDTVGMVIPNIASPYFSGIARKVDALCDAAGFSLMIFDTNENQEKEIRAIHDLVSRGVDGLIVAPVQEKDEHIRDLVRDNFPLVLIDRRFEDISTNAVICNDSDPAYNAVNLLADKGHRRIGFICGQPNLYPVVKRLEGYKQALSDFGLPFSDDLVAVGDATLESASYSTGALLSLPERPTAFLVSGTIITLGAMKAIFEKGLAIPGDVSILSFTDTIYAPFLKVPITTVVHPVEEIGQRAFNMLMQQIKSKGGEKKITQEVVETQFILRKSVASLHIGN